MQTLHMGHIAKTAIQSKQKSNKDVADALGITHQAMNHTLRSSTVKVERMEQIARFLGITTVKMFEMWILSNKE